MPLDKKYLLQQLAPLHASNRYLLGFSGGVDSTVLLHLLGSARHELGSIAAVHVNHQLHSDSTVWAEHCLHCCEALNISCEIVDVDVAPQASLEAQARVARYAAIEAMLNPNDVLLTAHHLDDQAETLLLQLMRGAGLPGLSAMPAKRNLGVGYLQRPLLGVSRDALVTYAADHRLKWIEDPSNQDSDVARRNFMRNRLLPQLSQKWPAANRLLARSAQHCADAERFISRRSEEKLERMGVLGCNQLPVELFTSWHAADWPFYLRQWIASCGQPLPDRSKLNIIRHELFLADDSAQPLVTWSGVEMRRYQGNAYLMRSLPAMGSPSGMKQWNPMDRFDVADMHGQLSLVSQDLHGIGNLQVTRRSGGEKLRPQGDSHDRTLKYLYQEGQVPPWLRGRLPLIYWNNQLHAVADLWKTDAFSDLLRHYQCELIFKSSYQS